MERLPSLLFHYFTKFSRVNKKCTPSQFFSLSNFVLILYNSTFEIVKLSIGSEKAGDVGKIAICRKGRGLVARISKYGKREFCSFLREKTQSTAVKIAQFFRHRKKGPILDHILTPLDTSHGFNSCHVVLG